MSSNVTDDSATITEESLRAGIRAMRDQDRRASAEQAVRIRAEQAVRIRACNEWWSQLTQEQRANPLAGIIQVSWSNGVPLHPNIYAKARAEGLI